MKFNLFARREKPLTGYALGRHGQPEALFKLARAAGDFNSKTSVLEGAIDAYLAGERENLRQFFTGYLDLKRVNGNISTMFNNTIDAGFLTLFADPMVHLMERSLDPAKTFAELAGQWSSFYRQIALDFTLRRACAANSDMVADCLIKLGADINAHNGRPIFVAIQNRSDRASRLLIGLGAMTDTEACSGWQDADIAYYDRLKNQLAKSAAAPELDLPVIAHKKRFTTDPAKDMLP